MAKGALVPGGVGLVEVGARVGALVATSGRDFVEDEVIPTFGERAAGVAPLRINFSLMSDRFLVASCRTSSVILFAA